MSEMIETVARHLKAQQQSLEGLLKALESALADVAQGIERSRDGDEPMRNMLGSVESAVADVVQALEKSNVAEAIDRAAQALAKMQPPTVNVPQQPAPIVTVNVPTQPAPVINVEAVMPRQDAPIVHVNVPPGRSPDSFEVRIKTAYGPDTIMTITPKFAE